MHDVVFGDESGENCGTSMVGLGDLDLDTFDDYAIGANEAGPSAGQVDVISGQTGSILYTLDGESTSEYFGVALANIGDIDGGGFAELVISAMLDKNQGFYEGTHAGARVRRLPPERHGSFRHARVPLSIRPTWPRRV